MLLKVLKNALKAYLEEESMDVEEVFSIEEYLVIRLNALAFAIRMCFAGDRVKVDVNLAYKEIHVRKDGVTFYVFDDFLVTHPHRGRYGIVTILTQVHYYLLLHVGRIGSVLDELETTIEKEYGQTQLLTS